MKVAALVAAAGSSSRMGTCKALLPYSGRLSFVRRLAEVYLSAGADPVIVTVPDGCYDNDVHDEDDEHGRRVRAQLHDLPVVIASNDAPALGLTGSVQCALTHATAAEALLISPVDCPFVDVGLVQVLVAAVRVAVAAVPIVGVGEATRRGHPAAFSRAAFELLWGADQIGGARAVLAGLGSEVIEVPWSDARVTEDVDTPADYQRLFGRMPRRP